MDDSWRTRFGTTNHPNNHLPPRRSTEDTNTNHQTLDPKDFDDVFGGPPRTVISRQYSLDGEFTRSLMFEEDVFTKPKRSDRLLPEFRIPVSGSGGGGGGRKREEEFYSDIFGSSSNSNSIWLSRSRSKSRTNSKSKSNSSSILSSEELSPFLATVVDDEDVSSSSFASRLRLINVASKWNTSEKMHEAHQTSFKQPYSPCNSHSFKSDYIHNLKGCYSGLSQRVSSPELATFGPNSYASLRESIEDLQANSPASTVSSSGQDQEDEVSTIHEEDDEVMSSYVIEINPNNRERISVHGVDEAIAWAKQKCQTGTSEKEWSKRGEEEHECPGVEEMPGVNAVPEVKTSRHGAKESSSLDKQEWTTEEPFQELEDDVSPSKQMELELLDEDIKLWSDGKESNVQLLLSTLHHILWPSSGWVMIHITNLKESSNVKKAYQKARLCLHPDKLQQRGATISQKYVAEKAFPILQDAWANFISRDVRSSLT